MKSSITNHQLIKWIIPGFLLLCAFTFLGTVFGQVGSFFGLVPSPKELLITAETDDLVAEAIFRDFWESHGFLIASMEISFNERSERRDDLNLSWEERSDEWFLVPRRPEITLTGTVELMTDLLETLGYTSEVFIDNYSVFVKVFKKIEELDEHVMIHQSKFVHVNPTSAFLPEMVAEGGEGEQIIVDTFSQPLLAIVIDDWGYASIAAQPLLQFPFPLTMAIIPHLSHSFEYARQGAVFGHEIILHQPMEAVNSGIDLGEGALYTFMDETEVREQLMRNVQHLPMISGVNNHMGSKATSDRRLMKDVLTVLKELELFFLDSYTIATSVVAEVAEEVGLPYAVNRLFIDNENEDEYIKEQIRRGIALAQKNGSAIMIGHVRPATARALWDSLPEIIESGVKIVPVSELLKYPQQRELDYQEAYRQTKEVEL